MTDTSLSSQALFNHVIPVKRNVNPLQNYLFLKREPPILIPMNKKFRTIFTLTLSALSMPPMCLRIGTYPWYRTVVRYGCAEDPSNSSLAPRSDTYSGRHIRMGFQVIISIVYLVQRHKYV